MFFLGMRSSLGDAIWKVKYYNLCHVDSCPSLLGMLIKVLYKMMMFSLLCFPKIVHIC